MANGSDTKIWNLANVIITVMAAIIAALISVGFYSLGTKIETGDAAIYSQLSKIEANLKYTSECIMRMQSDITRIDTLQKMRIERENREEQRKNNR